MTEATTKLNAEDEMMAKKKSRLSAPCLVRLTV
jgi:hypothetical protein